MRKKVLAILMIILLIVSSVDPRNFISPSQVSAEKANKPLKMPKGAERVRELEDLREPNTKTFINTDGTYTTEIYTENVHFKDEKTKKFKNISTTPEENTGNDREEFGFKNKDNKFGVKFAKNSKKKNLITIDFQKEKLNFQPVGTDFSVAEQEEGAIFYKEIFKGVDFKYSLGNSSVKEDIFLKSKDSVRSFQFLLTGSLIPKQEGRTINFYNKKDELVWVMPYPFMEDSNGKYSEDIAFDLAESTNGYLLTLTPSSEYLDDETTEYPVRIDPTTNLGGTNTTTLDTYVMSAYPSLNYYNSADLRIGYIASTGTTRSYLNFTNALPDLTGKLLVKAELKLYKWNDITSPVGANVYVNRVTSAWSQNAVTYYNQPSFYATAYGSTSAGGAAGWKTLDVTSLVNGWVDKAFPNYGMVVRSTSEGSSGTYQKFNASESSSNRPYLAITYSDKPAKPTLTADSYANETGGWVNLSWTPVTGATSYKVLIFNGAQYEEFPVGNVTSWTTKGKKLWPTKAQIDAAQYNLRKNADGRELPENPHYLYSKIPNGSYRTNTNYAIRIKAVNAYGETSQSDASTIIIPDKTKPRAPLGVTVTNDRIESFTIGWQPATDPDGTGVAKYKVFIGEQPGVPKQVNGAETTATSYKYTGTLEPRKTYYAWIQAVDKSGNISLNSQTTNKIARKEFDARIKSYYIPSVSDVDSTVGEKLWFDVENTGTASWTNDQNINMSVTSKSPDASESTGFVGYLNTGEVITTGQVKRFYVDWKPKAALKGLYEISAVVGKGSDSTFINPPEEIVNQVIDVQDLKGPSGNISINENALYTTSQNVTVKAFDVYDNATGDLFVEFASGPVGATVEQLQFLPKEKVTRGIHEKAWALPDVQGEHFIYARFSDTSGNVSQLYSDSIILDKTVPAIEVTNLESGDYLSGSKKIEGSITDLDLASYRVEYRNKADQAGIWNLISEKNLPVSQGVVADWSTASLAKGEYELRITARDAAGQTNLQTVSVWVDTLTKSWTGSEGYYPTHPLELRDGSGFVNLYNGSLNLLDVDFSLPSRAFSLVLGRSYSSNANQQGLLGKGWGSNLEERLEVKTDRVNYYDSDGTVHAFIKQADGSYATPSGTAYNLTYSSTNGYKLGQKNGNLAIKEFDLQGKPVSISDNNGNKIQYAYENGKLIKLTSANKSVDLNYANGRLDNAVFSTGDKIGYVYSGDFLSDVKVYTKSGKVSRQVHYDYEAGKLTAVVSKNNLKVEILYNGNRVVQTKTKRSTRVVDGTQTYPLKTYGNITESFSYDLSNNTVFVAANSINEDKTSKNLFNTEYELNSAGNLKLTTTLKTLFENEDPEAAKQDQGNITVQIEYVNNRVKSSTDALGNKTSFEYDSYGNVVKINLPPVTVKGVKTSYSISNQYNGNGQILKVTNTMGQVKEWRYDSKGNVFQILDEEGNSQYIDYDSYGNVTATRSDRGPLYGYMPDYSMEEKTLEDWKIVQGTITKSSAQARSGKQSIEMVPNAILQTGTFAIKKGRLPVLSLLYAKAAAADQAEVKLQFIKDSTVIQEYTKIYSVTTNWGGYRVSGETVPADATHVRVQVTNKGTTNLFVDDLVLEESGIKTTYHYDSNNENVDYVLDPYGYKTSYTFNEYGQPLTETNALNQTQTVVYDELQRISKNIDRSGRTTEYQYDEDSGNLRYEIDAQGNKTEYEYNEWDQLTLTTLPKVQNTFYKDEAVAKVEDQQAKLYVEYDELGRKIRENDESGKAYTEDEYDGYGRLARSIDPMKNQKYFSYDKNGNIIHTIDFAAVKSNPEGQGNLLVNKGETFATFDEWNRQLTETDNTGNRDVLTMVNTYDSEDRLVHTKDAEGSEVFYTYNALNENVYTKDNSTPAVETWSYFDGFGTPSITLSGNTIEYSVSDANGNVLESIDHKGAKTKYEYNKAGDKVKQVNPDGTTVTWTYNEDGQIDTESQLVETVGDIETYLVTDFVYNDTAEVKYQKVEAQRINKSTKALVDKQLIKEIDLNYDNLGRLVREQSKNHEGSQIKKSDIRFVYDLNGNLLQKWIYDETSNTIKDGVTYPFVRSESKYAYDANNRMLSEQKLENGILNTRTYSDEENMEKTSSVKTSSSSTGNTTVYYNENDLAQKVITPLSEVYEFTYTPTEMVDKIKGPRLTIDMDYGLNERMTKIRALKKDTSTELFSESYTYNSEEQIKDATNPWDGVKAYTYTPEGFLGTVKKGTETITYTYDVNGNLRKAVNQAGKVLLENQYGQANRITSSIQFDSALQKYKKVTYTFKPDGSLQKETISSAVDTYEAAKTAAIEFEKIYNFSSINLLQGIVTKRNGVEVEKVEFTYDSEENRTSKKVTKGTSVRTEFYYYDSNGDLIGIAEQSGIDAVQNLMNFYRDSNGQLLSLEYKGQIYDYIYNQRGDIVAIADQLKNIIAKYTYDEWGNVQKMDAPTTIGVEIANANPFRYVGKFGVQYDNNTKLHFMGWRDYDSKIGRFIVADEYEGDDTNPISFNRYLYAESDPVNNIDPDGYAPKWLKKLAKGVKKAAKATYNFAIGDDIRTLSSKKTKWYQKAGAALSIASNFIPGGGVISKAAKAVIKGTSKAVKAYRASKIVSKSSKVIRTTSKKVAATVKKKPKTVPAKSIKSTPKTQSVAPVKASYSKPKPKPKVVAPAKPRSVPQPRIEPKLTKPAAGDNIGFIPKLDNLNQGKSKQTLYHYTNEKGAAGILDSKKLNPSLKANNPKDARYGDGQYLSDIAPETKTPAQLARIFINVPNKYKFTHYVEIDVSDLDVKKGRDGVFVILNESPLDLTGRIVRSGKVGAE
ncbi:hypothetical protein AM500_04175 [Bacillus sp. FJAT-18017]|uniref:DNRLRE domain-containing protein n=1 Tax=Bacillus sp. FJAT-18017 TaxID=1705566 RepID=UPI0006AD879D|nr:DNRLRE domain-containing protein [Bacillus sp. FJAT-18017]ALC89078.1 hypothetical protein AM500_04175 [Bacillus sp. FJAT-18017]